MCFNVKLLYATRDQSQGAKWRWFRCLLKVEAFKKKKERPYETKMSRLDWIERKKQWKEHMGSDDAPIWGGSLEADSGGEENIGRLKVFIKWNTRSSIMQIMWKIQFMNMEIKRKQTLIHRQRDTKPDGRWKHPAQQNVAQTHFKQIHWSWGKSV